MEGGGEELDGMDVGAKAFYKKMVRGFGDGVARSTTYSRDVYAQGLVQTARVLRKGRGYSEYLAYTGWAV